MHPPRILVLATILGALVAGCTPAPPPTPSPVPTVPSCVPEFGGTPFPCTQAEYEASLKTQARYAEAERVFRQYVDLTNREYVDRRPAPSPELMELLGSAYGAGLAEVRADVLEAATYEGGVRVAWVRPTPHEGQGPGNHSLAACFDFSHWVIRPKAGAAEPMVAQPMTVDLDDASGRTVIVGISPLEGATCD